MKTLLVAVNAKFIHTGLAVRALRASCSRPERQVSVMEFTINQQEDYIIAEIFKFRPDVLGFSCYIWNIEMVTSISTTLKKILPETVLIMGGPEAAYDKARLLKEYPVDFVAEGQGEESLTRILDAIESRTKYEPLGRRQKSMSDFPFAYRDEEMESMGNKIIYYETSRGCPFRCSYCLSSVQENRLDFLPLDRVFRELEFFMVHGVRQVKLVDRTFNCNKKRAMAIWEFIMLKDRGVTNFHFEIAADLLDEETLSLLQNARPGLFQFEAGIQSFHSAALRAVNRKTDLTLLRERVQTLKSAGNIHLHLDLIAGLPFENYRSFQDSFNLTYRLAPEQLQLGFLKILKGSPLSRQTAEYGIVYTDKAPYEVLFTSWISYEELLRLKAVEEMVSIFYNSGKFEATLSYAINFFESPFSFFEAMAAYWEEKCLGHTQHRALELYEITRDFLIRQLVEEDADIIRDFLKYDLLTQDRVCLPEWMAESVAPEEKALMRKAAKGLKGIWQVEKFNWDIRLWLSEKALCRREHFLIFQYDRKEPLSGRIRGLVTSQSLFHES